MNEDGLRKTIKLMGDKLVFDEEAHTYTYDGTLMETSGSSLYKGFFPFDQDVIIPKIIAGRNPLYAGKTKEQILEMWDAKRNLGSQVHKFIEDYLNGEFIEITNAYECGIFKWLQGLKFEDVLTEVQICNPDWSIAGMIDCLIKQNGKWYIWDWKTDRRVDTSGFRGEMCTGELSEFPKCNFTKYMFQLGTYCHILASDYYDISIAGMKVVHIKDDGNITEYTVPYQKDAIDIVIHNYIHSQGSWSRNIEDDVD